MHGLETISHIRQGTGNNHRHGIVDVGFLHFLLNVDPNNPVLVKSLIFVHYSVSGLCLLGVHKIALNGIFVRFKPFCLHFKV